MYQRWHPAIAVQGLTTGGDLIIAVDGVEIKDFSELMITWC
jgi:hypothetical protein